MASALETNHQCLTRVLQTNWLFARLPPWVLDTLTSEQREAIHKAVTDPWDRHRVDIRLSIPFVHRRYYMTLVSGGEQRDSGRIAKERHRYPLRTAANVLFFVAVAVGFYAMALIGFAVYSAILEF